MIIEPRCGFVTRWRCTNRKWFDVLCSEMGFGPSACPLAKATIPVAGEQLRRSSFGCCTNELAGQSPFCALASDQRGVGLRIDAPEVCCGAHRKGAAMSLKAFTDGRPAQEAQKESCPLPRLTAWPQPSSDDDRQDGNEGRTDLPDVTGDDSEDRKAGPHWGGFWPTEHVPELDDVCFEPSVPKHAAEGFAVYSERGLLLGRFDDRWRAVGALNRWPHADFVLCDDRVIARKAHAAILIGETARAA
jgi:hypothetical protein